MIAVAVKNLNHTYPNGRAALHELSFEIAAGESVALVGPNGAGKTTLFLRLAGILPGIADHATVAGLDPALKVNRREIPKHLGIVFQNPDDQLFHASLEEDVAFGPLNLGLAHVEVKQRVAEALAAVNLTEKAQHPPDKLSGGERRRAAIATVLAMKPSIILFDEPTAFLDPRGRRELIALLNAMPVTKLIATHDLDFVRAACRRVLVLDSGRLFADGPMKNLEDDAFLDAHGLR
jgi:cobalt/nickel transport system ATP-binding protein